VSYQFLNNIDRELNCFCSRQPSAVAGPSSDIVYLEDIDPSARRVSA
jgi:hypothetical protein